MKHTVTGQFPVRTPLLPVGGRGYGMVLYNMGVPNGGWTGGDGNLVPIQLPVGTFRGTLLGFSLNWTGFLEQYAQTGAFHGKLGNIYAGLVKQPQSLPAAGWGTFPADTSLVQKMWDSETDAPFPLARISSTSVSGPLVVPDVRLFSFQLPQPIEVDSSLSMGIGIWLAPCIGPMVPLSNLVPGPGGATFGYGVGVASANYAIELEGEDITPAL